MRFAAWPAAYLMVLVPGMLALFAYAFRRRRLALAAFVTGELAAGAAADRRRRAWPRALCLAAAAACLVVALMQPQWGPGGQELPLRGRDVIVLLDVSASMLAEDVAPNRLAQAKAAARSLALAVQRDGGHRLGLLTFAGRADVQCPLTRDYGLFLKRLDDATTDSVARRGTSIGEAVRQAMRAFGELTPGYTDFVLISDGEDHRSLPLEAAQMLGMLQISLSTVGVGDPNRSVPIPLAAGDNGSGYLVHNGEEVLSQMRSGLLVGMADAAGGVYLGGQAEPGPARSMVRRARGRQAEARFSGRHQQGAGAAVWLFRSAGGRSIGARDDHAQGARGNRVKRAGQEQARPRLWAGLFALLPILGADQAEVAVREGNALYRRASTRRRCASTRRRRGAARSVRDRVQSRQCAVQEPRPGAGARSLSRRARDRRSGARQPRQVQHRRDQVSPGARRRAEIRGRADLAQAAIGYFRDSLRLDPGHADARYNLELAYRFHYRLEQDLLHAQRNAASPEDKTSLRRGQALSDKIRNEGSGQRDARPDLDRRPHGQRANEVPENYSNNEEKSKPPEMARLPVAMSRMARSS